MESFVWIGFAAFFVVSLVTGLRLVALWSRTRESPELLIGMGVLGIGPVGFGLLTLGELGMEAAPGPARLAFALGALAVCVGVFATALFTWRVYHPENHRVRWAVWAGGALLAATPVMEFCHSGFRSPGYDGSAYVVRALLQILCLLWSSCEALTYWTKMRRRLRLGLADPLVTNRFLLWGVAALAAGVGSAVGLGAQLATGLPPLEIDWLTLSSSLHGLTAAVAMWLAFLPTASYRSFIESRAPSAH